MGVKLRIYFTLSFIIPIILFIICIIATPIEFYKDRYLKKLLFAVLFSGIINIIVALFVGLHYYNNIVCKVFEENTSINVQKYTQLLILLIYIIGNIWNIYEVCNILKSSSHIGYKNDYKVLMITSLVLLVQFILNIIVVICNTECVSSFINDILKFREYNTGLMIPYYQLN